MLVVLFIVSGCSQKYPATFPVEGVLKIDGASVPNVNVTYVSKTGNPTAIGFTDSEGKYVLTTFKPKDGAMPGDCIVLLTPGDLKMGEDNRSLQELAIAQKSKVPVRYFEKETSDLAVTVESKKNNHTLEVQSK